MHVVHASFFLFLFTLHFQNKGIEKLDLTPATKCKFSNYEEVDGEYTSVKKFCENGKYFYEDDSYDEVCSDKPKPVTCGKEKGDNKKVVAESCKCGRDSDAPMCAIGDFCWYDEKTCEKKAFPCPVNFEAVSLTIFITFEPIPFDKYKIIKFLSLCAIFFFFSFFFFWFQFSGGRHGVVLWSDIIG